jgi:hypothetical protein
LNDRIHLEKPIGPRDFRDPLPTIADVAFDCGLATYAHATQAHLAAVFRNYKYSAQLQRRSCIQMVS